MDKRNFSNLGDEIRDIVQNAVNTMDFHQLNRDISNTVKGALDEVRNAMGTGYNDRYNRYDPNDRNENRDRQRENQRYRDRQENHRAQENRNYRSNAQFNHWQRNPQSQPYTHQNPPNQSNPPMKSQRNLIPSVPVGKVSGILLTVFGSIGMGIMGIGALVLGLIGQLTGKLGFFGTIAFGLLPFFFISVFMAAKGGRIRRRLQRFRRYLGIFQGRSYYSIKELSANSGLSRKFLLKDLRRMISLGMFPEGHIDEQETCFILNRESYHQYLELQKNMQMKNSNEQKNSSQKEKQSTGPEQAGHAQAISPEVKNAIDAGRTYIQQIKEANDALPGEEISRKLDRLEEVTGKIFNYIELHPAQLADIQKFMEYYLPTTLKLVNAYKEFDKQSVQGENITTAKNEIEGTLDTINLAFEKLLDSLFEDAAMDVSTDISVLETLLAQEGLTQKDFKSNRRMGGHTNDE